MNKNINLSTDNLPLLQNIIFFSYFLKYLLRERVLQDNSEVDQGGNKDDLRWKNIQSGIS